MALGRGFHRAVRSSCCDCRFQRAAIQQQTSPLIRQQQKRRFTITLPTRKHGAVPSFTLPPTSSPELTTLLTRFRDTIILPAHLPKADKKAIYNHHLASTLEQTPRVVELEGEEFTLRHIDKTKDLPSPGRDLIKVANLMQSRDEWANLPILLEGLNTASVSPLKHFPRVVRKMALAGHQDLILETARRVAKTGFSLESPELVREVMWAMHWMGMSQSGVRRQRKPAVVKKALRWAEQVDAMRAEKQHTGKNTRHQGRDIREKPEIVGVLLELAAVDAQLAKSEGKSVDLEKVDLYAKRFVDAWRLDENPLVKLVEEKKLTTQEGLRYLVPAQYGVQTALEVLDPAGETSKALKPIGKELATITLKLRDSVAGEGSSGLGTASYRILIEGIDEEAESQEDSTESHSE